MTTISAIGMIIITYYVYRLTSEANKKEHYFSQIAKLYDKIEEEVLFLVLDKNDGQKNVSHSKKEQSSRRISVYSTLMIYYILRIPGYYDGRMEFMGILYRISRNPQNLDNYKELSEKHKEFCWELREMKKVKHSFSFDYDGRPIK